MRLAPLALAFAALYAPPIAAEIRPPIERPPGPAVHDVITSRDHADLAFRLAEINERLAADNASAIPFYDDVAVGDGRKSLLSLGEGGSDFVGVLLDRRRLILGSGGTDGVHAVDQAYMARPRFSDAGVEKNKAYRERYPRNYHGQLFQHLD